jgi:crossover junction endodeoxyribonuclease RuvC
MRILGVDPGTWRMGIGIIETKNSGYREIHSCVVTIKEKKASVPARLHLLYKALLETIEEYRPEILALEKFFFGKDFEAMVRVGEARACAMLAASEHRLEVVEYSPMHVKRSVTGNGHATKEQIQHMTKTLLGLREIPPPDSADALAIAICHAHYGTGSQKLKCAAGIR